MCLGSEQSSARENNQILGQDVPPDARIRDLVRLAELPAHLSAHGVIIAYYKMHKLAAQGVFRLHRIGRTFFVLADEIPSIAEILKNPLPKPPRKRRSDAKTPAPSTIAAE